MAKNTRVTVRLTEDVYDALSYISERTGNPRGRILGEILEGASASLLTIASAFRAADAVAGDEKASLMAAMGKAEEQLMAVLSETMQGIEQAPGMEDAARSETRGARPEGPPRQRGSSRADPPILSGGFTTPKRGR